LRKPAGERAGKGRERASLGASEREAREQEQKVTVYHPGQDGEQRPAGDNARKQLTLPEAVAQPAHRDLEETIGEGEGAADITHLHLRQAQVGAHGGGGLRDTDAVEIGDERDENCQHKEAVTSPRGCFRRVTAGD
jgi:hypothetical protein